MKQFFTILKFELDNYFKSKSYVISTILIAVLAAGIMFVPRVKDAITGDKKDSTVQDSASKEDSSVDVELASYVEQKIEERKAAKKAKNFALADEIRDELAERGVVLKDTREGTTWSVE